MLRVVDLSSQTVRLGQSVRNYQSVKVKKSVKLSISQTRLKVFLKFKHHFSVARNKLYPKH